MISKIIYIALLVTCSQAQYDGHQAAVSSVSFNNHHNTIHHIHSAPTVVKTISAPVHSAPVAPVKAAAPVYSIPHSQVSSYSSGGLSASQFTGPVSSSQHAAPTVHYTAPITKVAAPVLFKTAAPVHSANSYSSLSVGHSAPAPSISKITPIAAPAIHFTPAVHSAPAVYVAPAAQAAPAHHVEEYAHPKYEFAYGVEDHHTGDIHSHKEARDGDVTHGEYSLHEADGTIRTVKYTVDKHSGFNAVVERTGHAAHTQPAPVAKAVVAAPVVTKTLVAAPTYAHYHH